MSPAALFCSDYEDICGFGGDGRWPDLQGCVDGYNGLSMARQSCVETHLGFAEAMNDPGTHCPHATGEAPCN